MQSTVTFGVTINNLVDPGNEVAQSTVTLVCVSVVRECEMLCGRLDIMAVNAVNKVGKKN